MNKLSEEQFIREVCLRLDRSIAGLDSNVNAQLTAARMSALSLQSKSLKDPALLEEDFLIDGVVNTLDDNQSVPPEIERKLDQIRQRAVAQHSQQEHTPRPLAFVEDFLERGKEFLYSGFNIPAGMVATACLSVTVVSLFYVNTNEERFGPVDEETLMIASAEDFELYENLDFYLWLEELEQTN